MRKATLLKLDAVNGKLTRNTINWNNGYTFKGKSDIDDYEIHITSIGTVISTGNYYLIVALNKKDVYQFKIKLIRYVMKQVHNRIVENEKRNLQLFRQRSNLYDMLPPSLK